jgi:hypothetical protein
VRTEPRFLIGAGAFATVVAFVYWFLSYEQAGFALLLLMGLASSMVGVYFLWKLGKVRRFEDDPDAEHAASAGVAVGRFSSGSIWPLVMAVSLVFLTQGLVFGLWLVVFGVTLFVWATVGLMLESRD